MKDDRIGGSYEKEKCNQLKKGKGQHSSTNPEGWKTSVWNGAGSYRIQSAELSFLRGA